VYHDVSAHLLTSKQALRGPRPAPQRPSARAHRPPTLRCCHRRRRRYLQRWQRPFSLDHHPRRRSGSDLRLTLLLRQRLRRSSLALHGVLRPISKTTQCRMPGRTRSRYHLVKTLQCLRHALPRPLATARALHPWAHPKSQLRLEFYRSRYAYSRWRRPS
jgi:hypothetical protein